MTERAMKLMDALLDTAKNQNCSVDTTLHNIEVQPSLFLVRVKLDGTLRRIEYSAKRRLRIAPPYKAQEYEYLSNAFVQGPNIRLPDELTE